ncbi:hypothetical protein DFP72DRAFT_1055047 [Ephemerocybe angulata]|uniref:Uncharacterized protein n=1 Tax=Ephemerocybe angulata TaxID=980116 RepID=A0A8H6LTC9_9AGAR|nr:hypothetical protein DFP72DRAFT_1055047 [Tulosesus angulatus]
MLGTSLSDDLGTLLAVVEGEIERWTHAGPLRFATWPRGSEGEATTIRRIIQYGTLDIARSLSYTPTSVPPVVMVETREKAPRRRARDPTFYSAEVNTLEVQPTGFLQYRQRPQNNPHFTIAAAREQANLPLFKFVFLPPQTGLRLLRIWGAIRSMPASLRLLWAQKSCSCNGGGGGESTLAPGRALKSTFDDANAQSAGSRGGIVPLHSLPPSIQRALSCAWIIMIEWLSLPVFDLATIGSRPRDRHCASIFAPARGQWISSKMRRFKTQVLSVPEHGECAWTRTTHEVQDKSKRDATRLLGAAFWEGDSRATATSLLSTSNTMFVDSEDDIDDSARQAKRGFPEDRHEAMKHGSVHGRLIRSARTYGGIGAPSTYAGGGPDLTPFGALSPLIKRL